MHFYTYGDREVSMFKKMLSPAQVEFHPKSNRNQWPNHQWFIPPMIYLIHLKLRVPSKNVKTVLLWACDIHSKNLKILSNDFVTQQRASLIPEESSFSGQEKLLDNLSTGKMKKCRSQMALLFHNWKIYFTISKVKLGSTYYPYNLSTIRCSKGRVMVKWTDKGTKKSLETSIVHSHHQGLH